MKTYSPVNTREMREWFQSLWNRPALEKEELKKGDHLVASLWKSPDGLLRADCHLLGDCERDNVNVLVFQLKQDPDLDNGIRLFEEECHEIFAWHFEKAANPVAVWSSGNVALTREEALMVRKLFAPFPSQRFLNVCRELAAAKRRKRERRIQQAVSRAAGDYGPGTVAI